MQGVGTKSDLQVVLMDSQYFDASCSPSFVATALSGEPACFGAAGFPSHPGPVCRQP